MSMMQFRKDYKTALSKNFRVNEFACHGKGCCSKVTIDSELVDVLQKIRDHFKKPVTISSAYRCPTHNKAIGGASNSYHTKGMAADIYITGVKPLEIAKYAESIGVKGIGLYEGDDGNFVHVDTRTNKSFWYGHAQQYRSTFGGSKGKASVKAWQQAAIKDGFSLVVDGVWGKECIAVAQKAVCKKYLIGYKNRNLTKIVQKAVGVTADGKFGSATKKAVIKWQKRLGIKTDGIVGLSTWRKILGVK